MVCPRHHHPPNGGWGWVVCFASALVHVFVLGMQYSSGVLVSSWLDVYVDNTRAEVSLVASIALSGMLGCGAVTGSVVQRFGPRIVSFSGGLLLSLSLLISSFADDTQLWHLYLSYGVLAGLAMSLSFAPAVMVVTSYFTTRRALATGIAVAGSGIGTFVMAPITQALVSAYDWRVALRVLAAIGFTVVCGCSLTFVPLGVTAAALHTRRLQRSASSRRALAASASTPTIPVSPGGRQDLKVIGASPRADDTVGGAPAAAAGTVCPPEAVGPLAADAAASATSTPATSAAGTPATATPATSAAGTPANPADDDHVVDVDDRVWTHPALRRVIWLAAVSSLGYFVPFVLLPLYAEEEAGLSDRRAASLISAVGIASTVGRVLYGRLADHPRVSRLGLFALSMQLTGVATVVFGFIENFYLLAVVAVVFGLHTGAFVAQASVVAAEIRGIVLLPRSLGAIYSVQFLPVLVGPPLAGLLVDQTGNYTLTFAVAGLVMLVSTAFLLRMPPYGPKKESPPVDQQVKAVTDPGTLPPPAQPSGSVDESTVGVELTSV